MGPRPHTFGQRMHGGVLLGASFSTTLSDLIEVQQWINRQYALHLCADLVHSHFGAWKLEKKLQPRLRGRMSSTLQSATCVFGFYKVSLLCPVRTNHRVQM